MSISLRKLAAKLLAAVTIVGTVTAANAAALEQPVAVLSSSLNASVGTVLTSDEVTTAAKAYSRAKADAAAQAKAAAAAKAEADAKAAAQAKADAEAKKKAEEEAKKAATLITAPVAARSVSYSAEYLATDAIKANATALGSRVYIEGYGTFIAEDTGSAIKNNKIDIFVSTHSRAEELGVQYANVYLLG